MKQLFIATLLLALTTTSAAAQYKVDYEFAPARWLTPMGLIDDWQKSMVDEQGRLTYDFGPGPYARPLTTIAFEVVGAGVDTVSQTLLNARTPVILTEHRNGTRRWRQTNFAIIPDEPQPSIPMSLDGSYRRHEGLVGSPAWAAAAAGRDASFRSVAWGTGRSIRYDIRVAVGSSRRVALGFMEVYKSRIGSRSMDFLVEGAAMQTVDLIETGGQHVPQVFFFDARDGNQDGWLEIEVTGTPGGQDPNTFINGIWVFQPLDKSSADDVIDGRATNLAETHVDAGMDLLRAGYVRMDVLRGVADGMADGAEGIVQVRVNTLRPLTIETATSTLHFDGVPFVTTHPSFDTATETENGWLLSFPAKTRAVDVLVTHGSSASPVPFPDLANAQRQAAEYWQKADLPWGRISVPDQEIQDLLDGGVRTLYQVREQVDGYAQFQPGASVYRGLWFGDGVWGAETAALLDDGEAARMSLDGMLRHQDKSGRIGVMKPALLHRETAHLIYGVCRYARLHQDWDWLESRWEQLSLAMDFLIQLRREASEDPADVYYGLFPPGLTDGGVAGVGPSYGSVYWGLIGMAEAVRTAIERKKPEAAAWKAEFDDFLKAFRNAAARDTRSDEYGNEFLPVKMDFDPEKDVPQRGQWGPIHSLYAGQFLTNDDPLVTGTLAMLDAHTEEGQVISLGWLTNGVWPIFEAHRALAYNWLGDADKAEELLYSFANHATPTLLWVEEQLPRARGTRTAGDVPHTVGNMQINRLVRFLLLLERHDDLEVLPGLPLSWMHAGARLTVDSLPTLFGPTTVKFEISKEGNSGSLWVQTPNPRAPTGNVRLNLGRLREAGFTQDDAGNLLANTVDLSWNRLYRLDFRKPNPVAPKAVGAKNN